MTREEIAQMAHNAYIRRSSGNPAMSEFVVGFLEGLQMGFEIKDPRLLEKFDLGLERGQLEVERIKAEQSAKDFNEWRNGHPRTAMTKADFDRRVMEQAQRPLQRPPPLPLSSNGVDAKYYRKPKTNLVSTILQTIFKK